MARHVVFDEYLYKVDKNNYKSYMELGCFSYKRRLIRQLLNLLNKSNWRICPGVGESVLTCVKKIGFELHIYTNLASTPTRLREVRAYINNELIFTWTERAKKYKCIKALEKAWIQNRSFENTKSHLFDEDLQKMTARVYNYIFDETL